MLVIRAYHPTESIDHFEAMWRKIPIAVSLLLLAASTTLLLRSYLRSDAIVYNGMDGHCAIQWVTGILVIGVDNVGSPNRSIGFDSWEVSKASDYRIGSGFWGRLGFAQDLTVTPTTNLSPEAVAAFPTAPPATIVSRRISLPLWLVVGLSLVLTARAGTNRMQAWRRRRGLQCVACGYDLRASPERCPECGEPVGRTAAT